MKTHRLYLLLIISILFSCANCIIAQTSQNVFHDVRTELNRVFSGLNKNRVPTHILLDQAINYADVKRYNGTSLADSTIVNRHIFVDILRTINEASVSSTPLISNMPFIIDSITEPISLNGEVTLAHAIFRYNTLKENAIEDGLIEVNNGILYEVIQNGTWLNPYNENYTFAFTSGTEICSKSSVKYTILNIPQLRNIEVLNLFFDADDGHGYRKINTTINNQISVNYASDGEKHLRLKVILQDGTTLVSHSNIIIKPDLEASINGADDNEFAEFGFSSEDGTASAQLSILRPNGSLGIRKPFIIVEGFDPWELGQILPNSDIDNTGFTTRGTYTQIFDSGVLSDYDYMYVDWHNSTVDIRTNAEILIKIINFVNELKTTTDPIVIMGQSMGGLITRYALCIMEAMGMPHQVSTYISHDSPHLGANLPLGFQYFISQIVSLVSDYSTLKSAVDLFTGSSLSEAELAILNTLHSDAAKQMLMLYLNEQGYIDDSFHSAWQTELDQLGFPQGDNGQNFESLAVVNGGIFNLSEELTEGHLLYANLYASSYELFSSFLLYETYKIARKIFSRHSEQIDSIYGDIKDSQNTMLSFQGNIEVNPHTQASTGDLLSKLKLQYTYWTLWSNEPRSHNIFNSEVFIPHNISGYDDYYGSYYNLGSLAYSDSEEGWAGEYAYSLSVADSFMFIPTASALAHSAGLAYPNKHRDYYINRPIPNEETPFDAYFLSDGSSVHISTEYEIFEWINKQLNLKIEGPNLVTHSANFSVPGIYSSVTWTSSDPTIAEFEENGKLVAKGNGFVTITAESYRDGELYRKQKTVKVGMPEFCITKQYYPNVGYEFTATVTDSEAEFINDLVASGEVNFEWKIIDSDGALNDVESSGATATYMIAEDELVTIAVSLITSEGEKSPARTLTINLQTPFSVNYKYVVIDSGKRVYWVKEDGTYEVAGHTEDLTFTFRNLALGSEDNILSLANKYIKGNKCYIGYNDEVANMSRILEGDKVSGEYKWTFPFFDLDIFCNAVRVGLIMNGNNSAVISNYEMVLLNTNYDLIQEVPFAVLCKPVFPEPLTPPIQLNPIVD